MYLVRKTSGVDEGRLYAMKIVPKKKVMKQPLTKLINCERQVGVTIILSYEEKNRFKCDCAPFDTQVLELIRHWPFVVHLHYAFSTPSKLHLVVDYAPGGDLHNQLQSSGKFASVRVRHYVAELVLVLERLHQNHIVYRDLKTENVLLDADGHIMLTDFGLCAQLAATADATATGYYGTVETMAPEMLGVRKTTASYGVAVDWWSLGVLTYELLTTRSLFNEKRCSADSTVIRRIRQTTPSLARCLSTVERDFVKALLCKDPRRRLNGNRRDATAIKAHAFFAGVDWRALAERRVLAPFRPVVRHSLDTGNFSSALTQRRAFDQPEEVPPNQGRKFSGYDFVADELR